jgi:hypothetical protein
MPIGYEFGFRRRVDVVRTMPSDWERRAFDLQHFVAGVNRLKLGEPLLQGEGRLRAVRGLDQNVLVLERRVQDRAEPAFIVLNKDRRHGADLDLSDRVSPGSHRIVRASRDDVAAERLDPSRIVLSHAEIVYLLPA